MTMPEDNHYIPIFYQKRWAGPDDQVRVYSRPYRNIQVKKKHPAGIGYQTDLYTAADPDIAVATYLEREFFKKSSLFDEFKKVDLAYSIVKGEVQLDRSILGDEVILGSINVGDNVSLNKITADSKLILSSAQIGGNLDLSGAELAAVDLGGASIAGELCLGDRNSRVTWAAPNGDINLRNAHVGSLSDNESSWPSQLSLDGFSFGHFGEHDGNSGAEMIGRGADWWNRNFIEHDSERGTSPYEQLATIFAAAGDRDAADEIRYDERIWADENAVSWATIAWGQISSMGRGLRHRIIYVSGAWLGAGPFAAWRPHPKVWRPRRRRREAWLSLVLRRKREQTLASRQPKEGLRRLLRQPAAQHVHALAGCFSSPRLPRWDGGSV
jgi:hypothetical protein